MYRVVMVYLDLVLQYLFLYVFMNVSACISIHLHASLTHISTQSCPFSLSLSLNLNLPLWPPHPVPSISPHYKPSITILAVCSCVVWKSFNFLCFNDYYKYFCYWLLFLYDDRPFLFFLNFLLVADLIQILLSVLGLSVLLPQPFMKEKDNYYLQ